MLSIPWKEIDSSVHQETVASINKKKAPAATKAGATPKKAFEAPAIPQGSWVHHRAMFDW
jgi:hypothetical protein